MWYHAGRPGEMDVNDSVCGCDECTAVPPRPCAGTHHAPAVVTRKLVPTAVAAEADSSPDAADEARPSHREELEHEAEILADLQRSTRSHRIAVFVINDEPYRLLLLTAAVHGGLPQGVSCTGHLLIPVPGTCRTSDRLFYAQHAETTLPFRSRDCACVRANIASDIVSSDDSIVLPGQRDPTRVFLPADVHQIYQELALALQQNGTVQGKAKGKGGRGGRGGRGGGGGIGGRGRARRAPRAPTARAARATSGVV